MQVSDSNFDDPKIKFDSYPSRKKNQYETMAHRISMYIREIYSFDHYEMMAELCERFLTKQKDGSWYLKEGARPDCRAWCSEMLDMMFPDDSKAIKQLLLKTIGPDEVESILEDILHYCTPEEEVDADDEAEEQLCGWCAESSEDCKCDEDQKEMAGCNYDTLTHIKTTPGGIKIFA
jgi:hypothetical protein